MHIKLMTFLNCLKNSQAKSSPFFFWRCSKIVLLVSKVLKREGYINHFEILQFKNHVFLKIFLDHTKRNNLRIFLKSSSTNYWSPRDFWKTGKGYSKILLKTSSGVSCDRVTMLSKKGGVLLFFIS